MPILIIKPRSRKRRIMLGYWEKKKFLNGVVDLNVENLFYLLIQIRHILFEQSLDKNF